MKIPEKCVILIMLYWSVLCFLTGEVHGAFPRQRVLFYPSDTSSELVVSALNMNPADITRIHTSAGALIYSNLFGLKELQYSHAGVAHNFSGKYIGIGASTFGNSAYSERTVSLLYGMTFSSAGAFGVAFHGYELSIAEYGIARTWGIDLGTRWRISKEVFWEIAYANLNNPKIGQSKDQLPQQIFTAVTCQPISGLSSRLSLLQNIRYLPRFGIDLTYSPLKLITFAAGINTEPFVANAGLTVQWQAIQVQYVFSSHASGLPYTHRFGLGVYL